MKKTLGVLVACGALVGPLTAWAQAPAQSDLERTVFMSMAIDKDYSKSRLGVRILGQQFAQDDAVCDVIAEKLLAEAGDPSNGTVFDAVQWYIVTIRDSCSGRYHDTLTTMRGRFTHPKLIKHLDAALAAPVDITVPQYKPGGVDMLTLQIDLLQEMGKLHGVSSYAHGAVPGTTFGQVLESAGMPEELAQITYRIARYGHSNALAAYYRNGGMLIFRRDYARKHWVVGEVLNELAPVSQTYKGKHFAVAQSVASLRGRVFREYIKRHGRQIRGETALLWALANRLTQAPFPSDKFEEDGLLVGVKLIAGSRNPEALQMLNQIGGAPGDDIPAKARAYANKVKNNTVAVEDAAVPDKPDEPDDAEDPDQAPMVEAPTAKKT